MNLWAIACNLTGVLSLIVVIGHQNPDLDSVVSAIYEARRRTLIEEDAQAFISGIPTREVKSLLQHLHLPLPSRWSPELSDLPTVLVDFNDLEQAPGCLRNVIAVIDHHQDSGDLDLISDKVIEPIGSTTTLIADCLLADHAQDLKEQDCLILLAAIISDTKSMLSPQTTARDRQVAERLARQCGRSIEQVTALLQDFSCYRFAPELVSEYVTQSKKCNTLSGHLVCSAAIETLDLRPFLPQQAVIAKGLRQLDGDVKALIVTDLRQEQTAIFHVGCLPLTSPYVMKGICLRKGEIRLLLERLLHRIPRHDGGG